MDKEITDFANIKVSQIMVKDPIYTTPDEKISVTELLMLRKKISGLPVVNNQKNLKLIGIITQRDIRLARFAMSLEAPSTIVKDLMTPEPITIRENDTIKDALKKFFEHQIERLPVVNENHQLIGIVLERSVLRSLLKFIKN